MNDDVRHQLQADKAETRPNTHTPPDDNCLPGKLRHTTGRERSHRDRGNASDSPGWRDHVGRNRD